MRSSTIPLSLFLILFSQYSCGGGGERSAINPDGAAESDGVASSAQSALSGKIVTEHIGSLWKVLLPSGEFVRYDIPEWGKDTFFNQNAFFDFSAKGYSDDGFTYRVTSCLPEDIDSNCFVLLDDEFNVEKSFFIREGLYGNVKVSRDGRYISTLREADTNGRYLTLSLADGSYVDRDYVAGYSSTISHEWHPDGRIFVTKSSSRNLFVTEPYQIELKAILSLPNDFPGSFGEMVLSPDGKKLAFELITEDSVLGSGTNVVVLNLETNRLQRLTRDAHTEKPSDIEIKRPRWSPDGRWILVSYSGFGGLGATAGSLPYLFAVPSDGIEVPLAPYDSSIPTSAIQISTNVQATIGTSDEQADKWLGADYYWLP